MKGNFLSNFLFDKDIDVHLFQQLLSVKIQTLDRYDDNNDEKRYF